MGKTPEDLEKSRQRRAEVIKIWGDVPTSVWNVDYNWGKSTIEFGRKQHEVAEEKHKKMKYNLKTFETQGGQSVTFNEPLDAFSVSSQNVRGKGAGLSIFPPDLCRKIVTYYSEESETILDPCCGHASRLETVHKLNRHYIGYDVCHDYVLFCEEVKKKITENLLFQSPYNIIIREQTSEKMVEQDNSIDCVFTSPPYWDLEYYDSSPLQLGYKKTYEEFLAGLTRILSECYRVLKPGRHCILNVNDFRKDSKFYMYHAHTANIMQKVGFKLADIIIVVWQSAIGAAFADQVWTRKITAKKHEYLIVCKKE